MVNLKPGMKFKCNCSPTCKHEGVIIGVGTDEKEGQSFIRWTIMSRGDEDKSHWIFNRWITPIMSIPCNTGMDD